MGRSDTAEHQATGEGQLVGVCMEQSPLRERICDALVAGGHTVSVRGTTAESLLASSNGNTRSASSSPPSARIARR